MRHLIMIGAAAAVVAAIAPAYARDGVQCVRLRDIQESPVVNEHTVVLRLTGNRYKRVSLTGGCTSLPYSGFAHSTPSDELCNSDPIVTQDGAGCVIESMQDISPTQAKDLLRKK